MANDKKNTLLEEGTVRRFMKLAEIAPLTNSFLEEYDETEALDEMPMPEDDEMEVELDADLPGEEAELDVDMGAPEEAPDAARDAEGIIMAMAAKLKDVAAEFGVEVELEGDVEPEEVEAPEMDMDVEMDMDMGEPEEAGLDTEPTEELEEIDVVNDEDLVNEVARRVTKRLLTKKDK